MRRNKNLSAVALARPDSGWTNNSNNAPTAQDRGGLPASGISAAAKLVPIAQDVKRRLMGLSRPVFADAAARDSSSPNPSSNTGGGGGTYSLASDILADQTVMLQLLSAASSNPNLEQITLFQPEPELELLQTMVLANGNDEQAACLQVLTRSYECILQNWCELYVELSMTLRNNKLLKHSIVQTMHEQQQQQQLQPQQLLQRQNSLSSVGARDTSSAPTLTRSLSLKFHPQHRQPIQSPGLLLTASDHADSTSNLSDTSTAHSIGLSTLSECSSTTSSSSSSIGSPFSTLSSSASSSYSSSPADGSVSWSASSLNSVTRSPSKYSRTDSSLMMMEMGESHWMQLAALPIVAPDASHPIVMDSKRARGLAALVCKRFVSLQSLSFGNIHFQEGQLPEPLRLLTTLNSLSIRNCALHAMPWYPNGLISLEIAGNPSFAFDHPGSGGGGGGGGTARAADTTGSALTLSASAQSIGSSNPPNIGISPSPDVVPVSISTAPSPSAVVESTTHTVSGAQGESVGSSDGSGSSSSGGASGDSWHLSTSVQTLSVSPAAGGNVVPLLVLPATDSRLSTGSTSSQPASTRNLAILGSNPNHAALLRLGQTLTSLSLTHNQLVEMPDVIVQYLTALEVLDLSHNRLSQLPNEIGHMTHLRSLDVSHNSLSALPLPLSFLKDSLVCLNIAANPFHDATLRDAHPEDTQAILNVLVTMWQEARTVNQIKVVILGHGNVGYV